MEAIAGLAAPAAAAAGWLPSSTGASLIGGGSSLRGRTNVAQRASCRFGTALVSQGRARSQTRAGLSELASLYPELEPRFGLRALPPRRASRVARRVSSEQNSEAKVEEAKVELEKQAEESKKTYNEAVDALKDQTNNLQNSAKGVYEPTAERAVEVLRDTTEKLREEADKARAILTATAAETAQLGKSNLSMLAENAPDPIKEVAETAVNAHLNENPTTKGAKIHDFCLGIPYGVLLVGGGLLWFIISGSTAAIRFGVILGGLLLFLSVKSLKVWKEGKSSIPYIQGQAAIAFIIFVKDARQFLATGAFFPPALSAFASGAILAFYAYVYLSGGNPPKKEKVAEPTLTS